MVNKNVQNIFAATHYTTSYSSMYSRLFEISKIMKNQNKQLCFSTWKSKVKHLKWIFFNSAAVYTECALAIAVLPTSDLQ